MMLRRKSIIVAAVMTLLSCTQNAPQEEALCARADVKDKVLDAFARSFTGNNGSLLALFDGTGAISETLVEDFKVRSTIENEQGQSDGQQINCTVTVATTESQKDPTPIEFREVRFALVPNGDATYQVIPEKGSFFKKVFIDGVSKAEWDRQKSEAAAAEKAAAEEERIRLSEAEQAEAEAKASTSLKEEADRTAADFEAIANEASN